MLKNFHKVTVITSTNETCTMPMWNSNQKEGNQIEIYANYFKHGALLKSEPIVCRFGGAVANI